MIHVFDFAQFFILENIKQSGTIPYEMQNITYLYAFGSQVGTITSTIPPQLGNIANLSSIDFDFQQITGTIPEQIYFLPNMASIDLNDNMMSGTISSNICNLEKLYFLQLGNQATGSNSFSGTIPACLGSLPIMGKCTFFSFLLV